MADKAVLKAMRGALCRGDLKKIQELVEQGVSVNDLLFDGKTRSALHVAVEQQRPKAVALLLSLGADPNRSSEQCEETPLHLACAEGDHAVLGILLDAGANPNTPDENGITPMMLAAEAPKNAAKLLERLLKSGGQVSANQHGRNPLHGKLQDHGVVELLVAAGADVNGSFHGVTPLMKAMEIALLCHLDPSQRSYERPRPKVIAQLVSCGADPHMAFPREMRFGADAKGKTIVAYAKQCKLPSSLMRVLESTGDAVRSSRSPRMISKKK